MCSNLMTAIAPEVTFAVTQWTPFKEQYLSGGRREVSNYIGDAKDVPEYDQENVATPL
jgi:hypothetical protein